MPRIKQIIIKHFKSIDNLSLDLGKLNVFIGTNGAGKSNILEAIGMLSVATKGDVQFPDLVSRGIRLSTPEVIRSSFKNEKRPATMTLSVKCDTFSYEANVHTMPNSDYVLTYSSESLHDKDGVIIAGRSNRSKGKQMTLRCQNKSTILKENDTDGNVLQRQKASSVIPVAIQFGDLGKDGETIRATIEALRKYAIFAPSTPVLRDLVADTSARPQLGIYGGGLAHTLSKFFKDKTLYKENFADIWQFMRNFSWLQSLGFATPKPELRSQYAGTGNIVAYFKDIYMRTNFNDLYAYDVSEGALYVLFVALLLTSPDSPKFFALDNVDSTLNPGMVKIMVNNIADFLEKHTDRQVILTTHNPTTLDAVDLFNPDHRLYVIERDIKGHTVARPIQVPEGVTREQWRDEFHGLRLSDIWLSGALGALPEENI